MLSRPDFRPALLRVRGRRPSEFPALLSGVAFISPPPGRRAAFSALRGGEVLLMVSAPMLELADREFPFLMRHPTNREDALQVLTISAWETEGRDILEAARHGLSQLARDLGWQKDGTRWKKAA